MKVALLNAHTAYAEGVACTLSGKLYSEYDLSCQINTSVSSILKSIDIDNVIIDASHVKTYDKSLSYKSVYVNESDATIAIETHFNSSQLGNKTTATGSEVLYGKDREDSKKLGEIMIAAMRQHLPFKIRRPETGGLYEHDKIWVLKSIHCPAIIIEVCFLTNPLDSIFLAQPRAIDIIAHTITEGITNYNACCDI